MQFFENFLMKISKNNLVYAYLVAFYQVFDAGMQINILCIIIHPTISDWKLKMIGNLKQSQVDRKKY